MSGTDFYRSAIISIHALLAESDAAGSVLPRAVQAISIHALLAESDAISSVGTQQNKDFYPRSPCGERLMAAALLLCGCSISIHALLAESDICIASGISVYIEFLSTLSLRRATNSNRYFHWQTVFLSTLSLRRATLPATRSSPSLLNFYPRSPCGERQPVYRGQHVVQGISIHALLAESDARLRVLLSDFCYFYPRSPCGERLLHRYTAQGRKVISIHALLAESDDRPVTFCVFGIISIHALLAESDDTPPAGAVQADRISIHALLAESDSSDKGSDRHSNDFYPRSPCGERPLPAAALVIKSLFLSTLSLRRATGSRSSSMYWQKISIHALLAESDHQK